MSSQTTASNKRSLEERAGVDQLVKGLSGTGITLPQLTTKSIMTKSLYGGQNVHTIFAAGLERRRRLAAAQLQLGYGVESAGTSTAEPPMKRRRFQRRNSKTPAMLFKSMNFLPKDLFEDKPSKVEDSAPKPQQQQRKTATEDDDDWEGGLEIAEQLVAHLKQRRLSDASVSAH